MPITGTVKFTNNALANIAIEQKPTAAPFRFIEDVDDTIHLNGFSEPMISVPAREITFAVPLEPKTIHKKIKTCSDSDEDVNDGMAETIIEGDFDDIVVSDSDMSTSVIIIDE